MKPNKKPDGAAGRTSGSPKTCKPDGSNVTAAAQRARLLAALKHRVLTTLQARRELDVLHPAARVMELRDGGYPITTTWTHDTTSEGHTHRVACYQLVGEARQRELPL